MRESHFDGSGLSAGGRKGVGGEFYGDCYIGLLLPPPPPPTTTTTPAPSTVNRKKANTNLTRAFQCQSASIVRETPLKGRQIRRSPAILPENKTPPLSGCREMCVSTSGGGGGGGGWGESCTIYEV